MSNIDELIEKTKRLNLHQRQLVANLIDEITNREESAPSRVKVESKDKDCRFTCSKGHPLKVGDTVCILNNRKTGKRGDLAKITQFNRTLIAQKLEKNGSYTQRDNSNIVHVSSK